MAAFLALHVRHNRFYTMGRTSPAFAPVRAKGIKEIGQFKKIVGQEGRSPVAQHDGGIGRAKACPRKGNGSETPTGVVVVNGAFPPVALDQGYGQFAAGERVEGMRHRARSRFILAINSI